MSGLGKRIRKPTRRARCYLGAHPMTGTVASCGGASVRRTAADGNACHGGEQKQMRTNQKKEGLCQNIRGFYVKTRIQFGGFCVKFWITINTRNPS